MERSRFVTVALVALSIFTVVHARNIVDFSFLNILCLVFIAVLVHGIATLCAPHRKLQSVSPLFSFFGLTIVLLVANSRGNLSNALPSINSIVNLISDSRAGVVDLRNGSSPFQYSTSGFLVAIILIWAICEIGETLAQRLHSSAPTLIWFALINAVIAGQKGTDSVILTTLIFCAASWFFLYSFERGHEAAKSHVIEIPKSSTAANYSQYAISFTALALISILMITPISNTPKFAPDVFKFLNRSNAKTELSPLVSMSQQLKSQKKQVLFTATANEVQYWRVAVLDDFDGEAWSLDSEAKQQPEKPLAGVTTRNLNGSVQLEALAPKFLPTFYSVQTISTDEIDFLQNSVVYAKDDSITNYSFSALAMPGALTTEQIEASSDDAPISVEKSILLPTDFDESIVNKSKEIRSKLFEQNKGTVYDQVIALRDFFLDGSFTYDLNVSYSSDTSSMQEFLSKRKGFCEQFAATYAAMARSIGIPARVVVGFTPGTPDANGRFTITNEQAHSWVEVYISNFGWLTIDPTPSGPLPGQAPTSIGQVVTTTTSTTTATVPTSQVPTSANITTLPNKSRSNQKTNSNSSNITIAALAVLVLGAAAAFYALRRRKKYGTKNDEEYIVATFKEIGQRVLDLEPQPDLTIAELVERVPENNEVVREFLAMLTLAAYAPNGEVTWKDVKLAASRARSEKIDIKK